MLSDTENETIETLVEPLKVSLPTVPALRDAIHALPCGKRRRQMRSTVGRDADTVRTGTGIARTLTLQTTTLPPDTMALAV